MNFSLPELNIFHTLEHFCMTIGFSETLTVLNTPLIMSLDLRFRNSRSLSLKPPESWIMMALDKKRTQFISFSTKELLLSTYVYENLNNPIWWCDFSCGHILLQICKVGTLLLSTSLMYPVNFNGWATKASLLMH